jgi:hypothetical protein
MTLPHSRRYSKIGSFDVGIVLQGEDEWELPEDLVAAVGFNRIDFDKVRKSLH